MEYEMNNNPSLALKNLSHGDMYRIMRLTTRAAVSTFMDKHGEEAGEWVIRNPVPVSEAKMLSDLVTTIDRLLESSGKQYSDIFDNEYPRVAMKLAESIEKRYLESLRGTLQA